MMRFFTSKKGQFYILIALLLISYAFILAREDVPVRKPKDNFQLLHEGFLAEGAVVVNNAVYGEENVSARFLEFSRDYVVFARSAEPGFRMVYLLKAGDSLLAGNGLDSQLNVTVSNVSYVIPSSSDRVFGAGDAAFSIGGISYSFAFSQEPFELKGFFRTSDRLAKRIFVKG